MSRKAFVAALVTLGGLAGSAAAQESSSPIPGTFSANVSIGTEYIYRGVSQTDEEPTIQGGFDWEHEIGIYLGVWASNVDFNDGDEAHIEMDFYGGYRGEFAGFTYDIGAIYYAYPGADDSLDYEFWEAQLAIGYDFEVVETTASVNYSPNFFADSDDAVYLKLAATVPLPYDLALSGHVGRQEVDDNRKFGLPDYTDWSLGITWTVSGFDLDLRYYDTNIDDDDCPDNCDGRAVFSISRSF